MPANWLEWLGVISSVLTIFWFVLYLRERSKRKLHDEYALGFLHGMKSRNTITSADWPHVVRQIDDTLEHLKPTKRPNPPASMDELD
jgi:hypothetical protein